MRKTLFIAISLLIESLACLSQEPLDSMGFRFQERYRRNFSVLTNVALDKERVPEYGRVQLDYTQDKGAFRKAQQAFNQRNIRFYTEGWSQLKRFRLAGKFMFNKQVEDSLSNNLRSDQDPLAPFYYFAGKAGNYNRQNYKADVLIAYDLLPERLAPLIKLDYQTHWTTGSVDPRPDIKIFTLKYKPGFMWSHSGHKLEVNGIFGHSLQEISIDYKNRDFKNSLRFPERIHYLNLGYGYASIKDSSSMRKYRKYLGGELAYSKAWANLDVQMQLEYEHIREESTHDFKSRKVYAIRDRFDMDAYKLNLLLDKRGAKYQQQWRVSASYKSGYDGARDFSPNLQRVNYEVFQQHMNIDYRISWQPGASREQELGARVGYQRLSQQDYAQGNGLDAAGFSFGLHLNSYWKDKQRNRYILHLSPFYYKPGEVELSMQENAINPFTRQVIFTDYYYKKTHVLGTELGLEYIAAAWIKGVPMGLYGQYQGLFRLNKETITLEGARDVGTRRDQFNLGLRLYL